MLKFIFYLLCMVLAIYLIYFIIIGFGLIFKSKKKEIKKKDYKFAILIAARNEEIVIGNLIDSLKKQSYSKDKYEIFVIVNNCTDNTYEVALNHDVNVIECKEKVSSKGEVLKFAYDKLRERTDIDAYVIFDADNVVHKDFLMKMNDALNKGYNVAQGFRDTKNMSDNWLSSSYAILYYMQSLFVNKPRYNLGKSSFINGTGFMVKKDIIDKYGFTPKTLTEDVEFTAMCALNNEKIAFVEEAITYDEQVIRFKDSLKQRKRWSFGTAQCLKFYYKPLIKDGIKKKNFECFDFLLFCLLSFVQILFIPISMCGFAFTLTSFKDLDIVSFSFVLLCMFLLVYCGGVILRMIIIKYYDKKIRDNLGGIFFFDLFLISWIPLNIVSLFMKDCEWKAIRHNRNINIEKC